MMSASPCASGTPLETTTKTGDLLMEGREGLRCLQGATQESFDSVLRTRVTLYSRHCENRVEEIWRWVFPGAEGILGSQAWFESQLHNLLALSSSGMTFLTVRW